MSNFEIDNFVFCEQVRPEVGGRYTLLGATAPELNVDVHNIDTSVSPAPIPLIPVSLFLIGTATAKGSFGAEIRVNSPKGEMIAGAKLQGDFNSSGPSSIGLGPFPIAASLQGEYVFEWKFGDNEWVKIATLKLNIKQTRATSETILSEMKQP